MSKKKNSDFKKSNLLKVFLILLVSLSAGCAKEYKPTVIDTQLQEGQVYKVIDKNNFTIQYEKSIPLKDMNGYICLSQEEAAFMKEEALNYKANCEAK